MRVERMVRATGTLSCPYCPTHPPIEVFRRYELVTNEPLRYCNGCWGFWAMGDALVRGVADDGQDHPALRAVVAPRRCRACGGHLKPDDACAKCGQTQPLLDCPACGRTMERYDKGAIRLDQCGGCRGVWFDVGEIGAVYGLSPVQGLAARTVDETVGPSDGTLLKQALWILARVFLPL
jgi:hypothetical protein